jgi:hypothetical protein
LFIITQAPAKEIITEFDDILTHVGGWGRYQKVLLLGSFLFTMILAYVQLTSVLFLYTPEHRRQMFSGHV